MSRATGSPDALLAGLDPEQLQAVQATRGPVVIHAGAGSGKTRVISHRVAYAVATEAVDRRQALIVTFTDKAAGEMVQRLASLGLPGIAARTFHAAALAQLRYLWPDRHDGQPAPEVLPSKAPILARIVRDLPGGYRFTPTKDLADEIEWAKSHRFTPASYAEGAPDRTPPLPQELFLRAWRDYERAKDRAGMLDFDDMLTRTIEILEEDEEAAAIVRRRYAWFSVDEYQDTSPLQQRLLELWLGSRDDLCVVGDEDQTIYSFTGASPAYLIDFTTRYPHATEVTLSRNYRSSPEVLALANRLLAAEGRRKRLVAVQPSGPAPLIRRCSHDDAELDLIVTRIRALLDGGTPGNEIAVLVRMNAQIPPIEGALTRARIRFQVRGQAFFQRKEVREAVRLLRKLPAKLRADALRDELEERLQATLGYQAGQGSAGFAQGAEARERDASLALLLDLVQGATVTNPAIDPNGIADDLDQRAADETSGSADGVNLLTLHRAKGLEWDAVFLPGLEEGSLPIRQAESDAEVAEERRLLYVGLTRARRHLVITWAERRMGPGDRESRRKPSRFLRDLEPTPAGSPSRAAQASRAAGSRASRTTEIAGAPMVTRSAPDQTLFEALRAWRLEHARTDAVPPYVIAHDSLLAAIVERRPDSIAALRRVPGVGPAKLEKYGEEILRVTKAAGGAR